MRFSTAKFHALDVAGPPKFGAELPALTALLPTVPSGERPRSVLITHVLETAVSYVEAVHSVFPVARVVAIPYSASPVAVQALRAKGFNVVIPASISDTFIESERQVTEALKEANLPLLVQEVGGYLAKASARLAAFPHFLGVVEDTNNGHWLYESTGPHPISVLSMAQSPLNRVDLPSRESLMKPES